MSAGLSARLVAVSALALAACAAVPAVGQDAPSVQAPEVENAKYNFQGTINANAVYVRSGPGDNYYPTVKLDQGANVTVVGIKFDWLKITPPEGSFSYVAKAYVSKTGDGTSGTVDKNDLNVRAGSTLNDMKTTVQAKLDQGTAVRILGEKDEYYKIASPAGTYLYVKKDFVTPGKPLAVANAAATEDPGKPSVVHETPIITGTPKVEPAASGEQMAVAPTTAPADATADGATTQPADAVAAAPATQPVLTPAARFDQLDGEFIAATSVPLAEQPLDELQKQYKDLVAEPALPESMKRVADIRLQTIAIRLEAKEQLLATLKQQQEAQQRQTAARAEKDELIERAKQNAVTVYAALGTVRTSALQGGGGGVLYRLTDPASGRTLVYLRTTDQKFASMIGQFVGVKGDIAEDSSMNLKYVVPTQTDVVDPTTIGANVTAQMIPPSILQTKATASTGN
ncbi:MAG TPA: hypothetical protein VK324_14360 [Tepidisphaeraceae bacterium]|nr:hypothetical protein [Tepidisphaeraceae bacterium]